MDVRINFFHVLPEELEFYPMIFGHRERGTRIQKVGHSDFGNLNFVFWELLFQFRALKMTQVHKRSTVRRLSFFLCLLKNLRHAGKLLNLSHTLSTAASASGIFIA